jgi:YD repeat-containing protein
MLSRLIALPLICGALVFAAPTAHAQQTGANDAVRVTVSQNNDGSRTTYEVDPANRRATSTTVSMQGKLLGKIRYVLDDVGRYQSGEVLDGREQLQFRTLYKYDGSGQLSEEHRLDKNDTLLMKIVYAYDSNGRPAGYSVYDPAGRMLGRTNAAAARGATADPAPPKRARR